MLPIQSIHFQQQPLGTPLRRLQVQQTKGRIKMNEDKNEFLEQWHRIQDIYKKIYDSSDKLINGLRSMKERGFSQEGMLEKVIEVTIVQSSQIKALADICHTYVSTTEFASKLAQAMVIEHEQNKKAQQ